MCQPVVAAAPASSTATSARGSRLRGDSPSAAVPDSPRASSPASSRALRSFAIAFSESLTTLRRFLEPSDLPTASRMRRCAAGFVSPCALHPASPGAEEPPPSTRPSPAAVLLRSGFELPLNKGRARTTSEQSPSKGLTPLARGIAPSEREGSRGRSPRPKLWPERSEPPKAVARGLRASGRARPRQFCRGLGPLKPPRFRPADRCPLPLSGRLVLSLCAEVKAVSVLHCGQIALPRRIRPRQNCSSRQFPF